MRPLSFSFKECVLVSRAHQEARAPPFLFVSSPPFPLSASPAQGLGLALEGKGVEGMIMLHKTMYPQRQHYVQFFKKKNDRVACALGSTCALLFSFPLPLFP